MFYYPLDSHPRVQITRLNVCEGKEAQKVRLQRDNRSEESLIAQLPERLTSSTQLAFLCPLELHFLHSFLFPSPRSISNSSNAFFLSSLQKIIEQVARQ